MSEQFFDSYSKRSSNARPILIAAGALVLLVGVATIAVWLTRPVLPTADDILAGEIRDRVVLMLSHPTFSGDEFHQQILGGGRLLGYIRVNDEAFFAFPEGDDAEYRAFLDRCFYDQGKLEHAESDGKYLRFGDYKIPATPPRHFIRTSLANIRVDPAQTLTFPYMTVEYTLSLAEMNDLISNSVLYGGKVIASQVERRTRPSTVFANHGIRVARPGEPSLERLSQALLKDAGPNREARIQRLVDFVSSEIAYNYVEGFGQQETLKRPNETLMTRNGDCSNKTILLASLLEQIGEEYLILYCPRHITIAVPQGDFPNENSLDFDWAERRWVVAETTLEGFQVGRTKLANKELVQTVNFVQEPQHMQEIFDANTFEVLDFF